MGIIIVLKIIADRQHVIEDVIAGDDPAAVRHAVEKAFIVIAHRVTAGLHITVKEFTAVERCDAVQFQFRGYEIEERALAGSIAPIEYRDVLEEDIRESFLRKYSARVSIVDIAAVGIYPLVDHVFFPV